MKWSKDMTSDDFKLYKMNGEELDDEQKLKRYLNPDKGKNSKKKDNFRFGLKNFIVFRFFYSD